MVNVELVRSQRSYPFQAVSTVILSEGKPACRQAGIF
jgi:hypothetical protein